MRPQAGTRKALNETYKRNSFRGRASLRSFLSTDFVGALSVHRVILQDEVRCMTRLARAVTVGVTSL